MPYYCMTMTKKRSRKALSRRSRSSRRYGSAYRPGLFGIHSGGLKDPAASKAERAIVVDLVKKMRKDELARHLSTITGHAPVYYEKNHTRKELASLAVTHHMHAFNVATDNYD